MKRLDFIKSLGIAVGSSIVPKSNLEKLVLPANNSNADMTFGTGNIERMRITYSGNLCISNTSPSTKLVIF